MKKDRSGMSLRPIFDAHMIPHKITANQCHLLPSTAIYCQTFAQKIWRQRLCRKDLISLQTLDVICRLLEFQPGDIIEYIPDQENEEGQ